MIDPSALAHELTSDPAGLGYEPHRILGEDAALAELLNQMRPESAFRFYLTVPSEQVRSAISQADRKALTEDDREHLSFLLGGPSVDFQSVAVRSDLGRMFPAGSETRARVLVLGARPGTRWEEMGWDHPPTALDVSHALEASRLAAAQAPDAPYEALLAIPGGPTPEMHARMQHAAFHKKHESVRQMSAKAHSARKTRSRASGINPDWLAGGR